MKYLYIIYQYLFAIPVLIVLTLLCAVSTMICMPWRNAEFVHRFQMLWCRCFCWLMFIPVTVDGVENLKKGQSYVFVGNHESMYDIFLIYGWLPVVFKWLMKAELKKVPFVGWACMAAGHIFVERRNARSAMNSLKDIERQLSNGVCTVIFPEGTRSTNGEVGRFKRGAFQIALDLKLPVVPLSLEGCYEVMNRRAWYVTRHPLHLHIGKPIDLAQFPADEPQVAIEAVRDAVIAGLHASEPK